mmetsp:Transcript_3427/g.8541  ORF Transcript_3427/g.8541 Transcript_3427/m.8541 type:complete len:237 (+) Transcript_3427:531-1241(+)
MGLQGGRHDVDARPQQILARHRLPLQPDVHTVAVAPQDAAPVDGGVNGIICQLPEVGQRAGLMAPSLCSLRTAGLPGQAHAPVPASLRVVLLVGQHAPARLHLRVRCCQVVQAFCGGSCVPVTTCPVLLGARLAARPPRHAPASSHCALLHDLPEQARLLRGERGVGVRAQLGQQHRVVRGGGRAAVLARCGRVRARVRVRAPRRLLPRHDARLIRQRHRPLVPVGISLIIHITAL